MAFNMLPPQGSLSPGVSWSDEDEEMVTDDEGGEACGLSVAVAGTSTASSSSSAAGSQKTSRTSSSKTRTSVVEGNGLVPMSVSVEDNGKGTAEGNTASATASMKKMNLRQTRSSTMVVDDDKMMPPPPERKVKRWRVKTSSNVMEAEQLTVGEIDDGEYIVERIVTKEWRDQGEGKMWHYEVKWKGWAENHNTWEPVANLSNCSEMLKEFEKRWNKGLIGDDDDVNVEADMEDEKAKEVLLADAMTSGIMTSWPKELDPQAIIGAFVYEKELVYIVTAKKTVAVELKNPKGKGKKSAMPKFEGGIEHKLVFAKTFKQLFQEIVISYYEGITSIVDASNESSDEADDEEAMANELLKAKETEESQDASEDEIDELGMPKPKTPKWAKGTDLYGLPESLESSDDSADDCEYTEAPLPLVVESDAK